MLYVRAHNQRTRIREKTERGFFSWCGWGIKTPLHAIFRRITAEVTCVLQLAFAHKVSFWNSIGILKVMYFMTWELSRCPLKCAVVIKPWKCVFIAYQLDVWYWHLIPLKSRSGHWNFRPNALSKLGEFQRIFNFSRCFVTPYPKTLFDHLRNNFFEQLVESRPHFLDFPEGTPHTLLISKLLWSIGFLSTLGVEHMCTPWWITTFCWLGCCAAASRQRMETMEYPFTKCS